VKNNLPDVLMGQHQGFDIDEYKTLEDEVVEDKVDKNFDVSVLIQTGGRQMRILCPAPGGTAKACR
jgi:hypothetical protein